MMLKAAVFALVVGCASAGRLGHEQQTLSSASADQNLRGALRVCTDCCDSFCAEKGMGFKSYMKGKGCKQIRDANKNPGCTVSKCCEGTATPSGAAPASGVDAGCENRDGAERFSADWCRCNKDGKLLTVKEDCENPGGERQGNCILEGGSCIAAGGTSGESAGDTPAPAEGSCAQNSGQDKCAACNANPKCASVGTGFACIPREQVESNGQTINECAATDTGGAAGAGDTPDTSAPDVCEAQPRWKDADYPKTLCKWCKLEGGVCKGGKTNDDDVLPEGDPLKDMAGAVGGLSWCEAKCQAKPGATDTPAAPDTPAAVPVPAVPEDDTGGAAVAVGACGAPGEHPIVCCDLRSKKPECTGAPFPANRESCLWDKGYCVNGPRKGGDTPSSGSGNVDEAMSALDHIDLLAEKYMFLLREAKEAAGDKDTITQLTKEISELEGALTEAAKGAAGAQQAIAEFQKGRETALNAFAEEARDVQAEITTSEAMMKSEATAFSTVKSQLEKAAADEKASQQAADEAKAEAEKALRKSTKMKELAEKRLKTVSTTCKNDALKKEVDHATLQVETSIKHAQNLQQKMAENMPSVTPETAPVTTEISSGLTDLIAQAQGLLKGSEAQVASLSTMMQTVQSVATTTTTTTTETASGAQRFKTLHASAAELHSKLLSQQQSVSSEIQDVIKAISDHGSFCTETVKTVESVSAKIQAGFGAVKETIGTLCTAIADLRQQEVTLKSQAKDKQGELAEKNEVIKTLQSKLEEQMTAFEKEKTEWNAKLTTFKEALISMTQSLEVQRQTNLHLQQELTENIKMLAAAVETTKSEALAITSDAAATTANIAGIKAQLQAGKDLDKACKDEAKALQESLTELQAGGIAESLAALQNKQTAWSAAYVNQLAATRTETRTFTRMSSTVMHETASVSVTTSVGTQTAETYRR